MSRIKNSEYKVSELKYLIRLFKLPETYNLTINKHREKKRKKIKETVQLEIEWLFRSLTSYVSNKLAQEWLLA